LTVEADQHPALAAAMAEFERLMNATEGAPDESAFQATFLAIHRELSGRYSRGTLPWIEANLPELWARIQGLEERIDAHWLAKGDLAGFEGVVADWRDAILEGQGVRQRERSQPIQPDLF